MKATFFNFLVLAWFSLPLNTYSSEMLIVMSRENCLLQTWALTITRENLHGFGMSNRIRELNNSIWIYSVYIVYSIWVCRHSVKIVKRRKCSNVVLVRNIVYMHGDQIDQVSSMMSRVVFPNQKASFFYLRNKKASFIQVYTDVQTSNICGEPI